MEEKGLVPSLRSIAIDGMDRSTPWVSRLRFARAPSVPAFSSLVLGRPHGASVPRGRCGTSVFRTLTGLIGTRDGPPRVALRESPPGHRGAVLRDPADLGKYSYIFTCRTTRSVWTPTPNKPWIRFRGAVHLWTVPRKCSPESSPRGLRWCGASLRPRTQTQSRSVPQWQ